MKAETRARRAEHARKRRAEWERLRAAKQPWPEDEKEQAKRRTAARAKFVARIRGTTDRTEPRAALRSGEEGNMP